MEGNKENMSSSFNMISSLLGRRPIQALKPCEEQSHAAPIIKPPVLNFEFSRPIQVLMKPEGSNSKAIKIEVKEKKTRKEEDNRKPPREKSKLDEKSLVKFGVKSLSKTSLESASHVKLPSSPRVNKISEKQVSSSWKPKVKKEEIPTPHWLLFFSPYLEDSIKLLVAIEKDTVPSEPINSSRGMRMILVDWMAMLQMFLRQEDSVLQLAVRILDMILSQHDVISEELQLTALTAFWIANKAIMQWEVPAAKLISLCKNSYTVKKLCKMEQSIMKSLNWHIPLDTPLSITAYQAKLLELSEHKELQHTTTLLLDVSLLSWDISWLPFSKLASAATYCALNLLSISKETEWNKLILEDPSCHNVSTIRDVICAQLQLLSSVQNPTTRFTGLRDKYKSIYCHKVGNLITEENIKAASLHFLAVAKK